MMTDRCHQKLAPAIVFGPCLDFIDRHHLEQPFLFDTAAGIKHVDDRLHVAGLELPIGPGLVLKAVIGFAYGMERDQRTEAVNSGFSQVIKCSESGEAPRQQGEAEQCFAYSADISAVVDQRMPFRV